MKIMQTITDYIQRSVLTTHGDMVVRGATIPERLVAVAVGQVLKSGGVGAIPAWAKPSISELGVKTGNFTRATGGTEVVTGVGFLPKVVLFFCRDTDLVKPNWSIGVDLVSEQVCLYQYLDGVNLNTRTDYSIYIHRDATNNLGGEISAVGADGFTVTFTLNLVCDATILWFAIG